jgi:hypothetical protein
MAYAATRPSILRQLAFLTAAQHGRELAAAQLPFGPLRAA